MDNNENKIDIIHSIYEKINEINNKIEEINNKIEEINKKINNNPPVIENQNPIIHLSPIIHPSPIIHSSPIIHPNPVIDSSPIIESIINSTADIKHGFYINLQSRTDRNIHVMKQLSLLGLDNVIHRFNAIQTTNGAIGCSISHLKCLQYAKKNNWPHILIIEDDIKFLKPDLFKNQLNGFFRRNKEWDVVLLAGNNTGKIIRNDEFSVQVTRCQTTTGYLVKSHYYDTFIENIKEGLSKLIKQPFNKKFFAIDKYWFRLQQTDKWYLIIPLTVVQREDYSDIEGHYTNYIKLMTKI
jgi:GR25 family glycosyltransferase involved in LPS biosynthesis